MPRARLDGVELWYELKGSGPYLVQIGGCLVCHQGTPQVAGWTESDFRSAMRYGITPDGFLDNTYMPWRNNAPMSDDDLRAMWLYLKSLSGGS